MVCDTWDSVSVIIPFRKEFYWTKKKAAAATFTYSELVQYLSNADSGPDEPRYQLDRVVPLIQDYLFAAKRPHQRRKLLQAAERQLGHAVKLILDLDPIGPFSPSVTFFIKMHISHNDCSRFDHEGWPVKPG